MIEPCRGRHKILRKYVEYMDYYKNEERRCCAGYIKISEYDDLVYMEVFVHEKYLQNRNDAIISLCKNDKCVGKASRNRAQGANTWMLTFSDKLEGAYPYLLYFDITRLICTLDENEEIRFDFKQRIVELYAAEAFPPAEAKTISENESMLHAEQAENTECAENTEYAENREDAKITEYAENTEDAENPESLREAEAVNKAENPEYAKKPEDVENPEYAENMENPESLGEAEAVNKAENQELHREAEAINKAENPELPGKDCAQGLNKTRAQNSIPRMKESKWAQLCMIYPRIYPFSDQRIYLKLCLQDFLVLPERYYSMAQNSFLRHGYLNYGYIVLKSRVYRGNLEYYLGVPGMYYEKEKQVAGLYGFEYFEGEKDYAENGSFGFYLMHVTL